MLQFIPLNSPDDVFSFLQQSDMRKQTWIVSDLKSKTEVQKLLLEKQGYFLDTSILRASDFWKLLLRRLDPQIQVVAKDFIQIVVDDFVEKFASELQMKSFEASTLGAYVQELAPVLLHPESERVLLEWFSQQPKEKKWQRWYLRAKSCMKFILQEHQMIDGQWIAAYLQTTPIENINWPTEIVVDLGTEMSSVEMGLFKLLSQKTDVTVLVPNPEWKERFSLLLKTYEDNQGYGKVKALPASSQDQLGENHFIRLSTQLAEVKFAVAQVRTWIEEKIPLNEIAVISSQIDRDYWPVLKFFFAQEGIPCQKEQVVKINSLGLVQNFLAYCTNLVAEVGWETLETSIYSRQDDSEFKFEQFKSLFYQVFDDSDLLRDEKIKNLFYKKVDLTKKLSREEFISFIVKFWSDAIQFHRLAHSEQHAQLFEIIFKDFLARSSELTCDFKKWLHFLQACINSKEIKLEQAPDQGIQILPSMSAHMAQCPYQIWLGLDEKALASRKRTLLPSSDIFELKSKFDLSIEYPEESFYDFNTRWLFGRKVKTKYYLCANSSFEAEPLTPSLFFLEKNSSHTVRVPAETRHDEIQTYLQLKDYSKQLESSIYDLTSVYADGLSKDLHPSPNLIQGLKFESMTPSDLEDLWNCSFKVLVSRSFGLRDLPQVAVDLDARQKGSLLHYLFEFITKIKTEAVLAGDIKEAIHKFLEVKRGDLNIYPNDDLLWTIQKTKLTQIGVKFFEFELQRQPIALEATEKTFELYFDLEKKEFLSSPANGKSIKFRGRIDRIDRDKNGIVIYDYKSTTSDLKNYNNWVDAGEFQLLLYLLACEKVLYPNLPVTASVYYNYRNFDFSKGYMTEEFHSTHIDNSRKRKAVGSADKKNELIAEFSDRLATILTKLENFDFSAEPTDPKHCMECNWNKLCRAQHLM